MHSKEFELAAIYEKGLKGNLGCWCELTLKLLQMMPKLQILLDKGNVTFNNNNKRNRFRVLNFPRAAILDFMMSLHCPIVSNKRTSAVQQ